MNKYNKIGFDFFARQKNEDLIYVLHELVNMSFLFEIK